MSNNIFTNSKAIYVDTYSQKSSHEMFNASLILMCSIIFKEIDCILSNSSYQNYLKIIDRPSPNNVCFKHTFVVEGSSRMNLILRYLVSAFQNIRYLLFSSPEVILIFPFNNLFSLRIMNFINKFYKRKIVIFCHAEMEGILMKNINSGRLYRVLTNLSHNFFLNSNIVISEGIYFSVLGDVLKENIRKILPEDKAIRFISVDHPYLFNYNEIAKVENSKMKIATIGSISKSKGLYGLIEFSNKLNISIRKNVLISIVGTTHEDVSIFKNTNIELVSKKGSLMDREVFNHKIMEQDYILFFYPSTNYKITASGAVMDALCYEKPIIALKNDYFEYLFSKYGSFGFLVDNIDEMVNIIEELSTNKNNIVDIDFRDIKKRLNPNDICMQLFDEMKKIGFLRA